MSFARNALWASPRAPEKHRSDGLSATFRNLDADAREDLTIRYEAFCLHYGMVSTRDNLSASHENGHLTRELVNAQLPRPARAFDDFSSWRSFVDKIVGRGDVRNVKRIDQKRLALKACGRSIQTPSSKNPKSPSPIEAAAFKNA